jgi:FkbM family methyltransferase
MNYNNNAFNGLEDRRYHNWDGYSLVYTYDFIKSLEPYLNMEEIDIIFEIGSRDGCQSMELSDWFPNSTIHLFEPVEYSFNYCSQIQTVNRPNIKCHKMVLSDVTGKIDFYEVINGNIGASSILEVKNNDSIILGNGKQLKIVTDSMKGDDFINEYQIPKIDLIWMDVQGAEKFVLNGFNKNIQNVKAIYTEIAMDSHYKDGTNLDDLLLYMNNQGFIPIKYIGTPNQFTEFDIIFLNKKYKND